MQGWIWLLARGALVTLELFAVSLVASAVLGLVMAAILDSRHVWIASIGRLYSLLFRGVPPIILLLAVFLGLPRIGAQLPAFLTATIGITSYGLAYMGEIVRAGLKSVPTGVRDAARALGLPYAHALRRIYLPQALSVILPPFVNEATELLKDTAIASIVGVTELADAANTVTNITYQPLQVFAVAALFYAIPTSGLLLAQERAARRVWRGGR